MYNTQLLWVRGKEGEVGKHVPGGVHERKDTGRIVNVWFFPHEEGVRIEQFWHKAGHKVAVVATQLLQTPRGRETKDLRPYTMQLFSLCNYVPTYILTPCQMDISSSCPRGH